MQRCFNLLQQDNKKRLKYNIILIPIILIIITLFEIQLITEVFNLSERSQYYLSNLSIGVSILGGLVLFILEIILYLNFELAILNQRSIFHTQSGPLFHPDSETLQQIILQNNLHPVHLHFTTLNIADYHSFVNETLKKVIFGRIGALVGGSLLASWLLGTKITLSDYISDSIYISQPSTLSSSSTSYNYSQYKHVSES